MAALLHGVLLLRELARPRPVAATPDPYWPDLNRDRAGPLLLLPGIGPTLAAAIVAEREAGGPFRDLADLRRVRGIGPRTLEQIRPGLGPEALSKGAATEAGP